MCMSDELKKKGNKARKKVIYLTNVAHPYDQSRSRQYTNAIKLKCVVNTRFENNTTISQHAIAVNIILTGVRIGRRVNITILHTLHIDASIHIVILRYVCIGRYV